MEETKDVGNSLSVRMTSLLSFAEYDLRELTITDVSCKMHQHKHTIIMH